MTRYFKTPHKKLYSSFLILSKKISLKFSGYREYSHAWNLLHRASHNMFNIFCDCDGLRPAVAKYVLCDLRYTKGSIFIKTC